MGMDGVWWALTAGGVRADRMKSCRQEEFMPIGELLHRHERLIYIGSFSARTTPIMAYV